MKLLAILGSAFLLIYFVGLIVMTVLNLSRTMFDPYVRGHNGFGFFARQGMVFLWPLAMITDSGREVFLLIWKGEQE